MKRIRPLTEAEIAGRVSQEEAAEIIEELRDAIIEKFYDWDIDVDIAKNAEFAISGSRAFGIPKKRSDLDIVMHYTNPSSDEYDEDVPTYDEDHMFNMLNDPYDNGRKFKINGYTIDINPINDEETGSLEDYLARAKAYSEEKMSKLKGYAAEAIDPKAYDYTDTYDGGEMKKGNHARLKSTNEPFWIGAVSLIDGEIEEVHSFQRAENADFHHSRYFSDSALGDLGDGDSVIFFVQPGGKVHIWDDADTPPIDEAKRLYLIGRIVEQISFK